MQLPFVFIQPAVCHNNRPGEFDRCVLDVWRTHTLPLNADSNAHNRAVLSN